MPPLIMGRDTPLHACLEQNPKFDDGYKMAADLREIYDVGPGRASGSIDVAKGLEGLRRQDGIHAAAVVITREPLTEYLPIQRKPEPGGDHRGRAGRHPVRDARGRGARPAEDGLPRPAQPRRHRDHARAHRAVHRRAGPTSTTSRSTTRRPSSCCAGRHDRRVPARRRADARADPLVAPDSFEDVAAVIALYRPGPMAQNRHNEYADRKNGRKPITYPHPDARGAARAHLRADGVPGAADAR